MQLPYLDVYAPRYCQAQIDLLKHTRNCGILDAVGIDEAVDGTFGGIRVTFSDNRVMKLYVDARTAILASRSV
jgi:hypothetical protein